MRYLLNRRHPVNSWKPQSVRPSGKHRHKSRHSLWSYHTILLPALQLSFFIITPHSLTSIISWISGAPYSAPPVFTCKLGETRQIPLLWVWPHKTVICLSGWFRITSVKTSPTALQEKCGSQSSAEISPSCQQASRKGGVWIRTITFSYWAKASGKVFRK